MMVPTASDNHALSDLHVDVDGYTPETLCQRTVASRSLRAPAGKMRKVSQRVRLTGAVGFAFIHQT